MVLYLNAKKALNCTRYIHNGGEIKHILILLTFFTSLLYSQEYCAGDVISEAHQNQTFDVCYPCEECEGWSLSEHVGDILFIDMSASWCAPCFSSIAVIDELEEYWSSTNSLSLIHI